MEKLVRPEGCREIENARAELAIWIDEQTYGRERAHRNERPMSAAMFAGPPPELIRAVEEAKERFPRAAVFLAAERQFHARSGAASAAGYRAMEALTKGATAEEAQAILDARPPAGWK